jgi:hypothetical protein
VSKWKTVMTLALFIYSIGVVFFALVPFDDIDWAEWVAAVLAGIAAICLAGYAIPNVVLPGERYAYLMAGWAGFTCMLLYLLDTVDSPYRRTAITLFLMSGAISGYGAHLARDDAEGV